MPDAISVLSSVVELFGWFGFIVGTPFVMAGMAQRARSRRFQETIAVVIPPPAYARAATARWMGADGELHEGELGEFPIDTPIETELVIHVDPARPGRARTDTPHEDGRALRVAGWALVVVGAVCAVASVVFLFFG